MIEKSVEQKNLTLNKVLVVIALVTLFGGLLTGGIAWAKGWLGLPEKVNALELSNLTNTTLLISLPLRVDNLERAQVQMWQKRSEDHDLLLGISQSLHDLKDQAQETRQDVKDLHNKVIK
jgi:hypothetical protein